MTSKSENGQSNLFVLQQTWLENYDIKSLYKVLNSIILNVSLIFDSKTVINFVKEFFTTQFNVGFFRVKATINFVKEIC